MMMIGNVKKSRAIQAVVLAIVVVALSTQQTNCQLDEQYGSSGSGPRNGLLSLFLSPLRATFDTANRLLGNGLNQVQGGVDAVQMQAFNVFLRIYNKTYPAHELPRRMALFFDRRQQIEQSVKAFREGRSSFMMRENAFIDWDENEIKSLTGVSLPSVNELLPEEKVILSQSNDIDEQAPRKLKVSSSIMSDTDAMDHQSGGEDDGADLDDLESKMMVKAESLPARKDWRKSECISTPINQEKCGACYAIATMSVVESMRCLNKVSSPILSAQQIVDCATPRAGYQNFGCEGGWPTRVLKYLQDVGTVARETCYPFVRRQSMCRLTDVKNKSGCTVSASPSDTQLRYKVLNNERDILYHVAKTGPVVTVMRATNEFLYYGSGIFDDRTCSRRRDDVDHAIVIVGYGRENGQDYWLIKNSWGTKTWGINGYGKYRRGVNACSIGHWGWVITS